MTRRIVTGNNSEGKSYFVHDGPSPTRLNMGMVIHEQFWIDDPAAPDPAATKDPVDVDTPPLTPAYKRLVVPHRHLLPRGSHTGNQPGGVG